MPPSAKPVILFTAFEPSGDSHAAPVIRALRSRLPDHHIVAWGGPKMAEAGATVVEHTAVDGAMGLGAIAKVKSVRKTIGSIKRWSKERRVVVHVPVDSPAANFPLCKVLRKQGARTVHLVAPQLWAWGRSRVGKLRRRTNLVLCLLPFEEEWFKARRIPAKFIGHPMINRDLDMNAIRDAASTLPRSAPRLAIFPGSRTQEVKKNLRLLLGVYTELQGRHAGMCGIVAAARPELAHLIKSRITVMPTALHVVTTDPDAAVHWCDLALTVSGTMSLVIARQAKPMIGVYKVSRFAKIASKMILRTPHRLLPNTVAGKRIVPEFVPYAGGPMPIVRAATPYLLDSQKGREQKAALKAMLKQFEGRQPDVEAAELIARVARGDS